jgi:hypothetical protein
MMSYAFCFLFLGFSLLFLLHVTFLRVYVLLSPFSFLPFPNANLALLNLSGKKPIHIAITIALDSRVVYLEGHQAGTGV